LPANDDGVPHFPCGTPSSFSIGKKFSRRYAVSLRSPPCNLPAGSATAASHLPFLTPPRRTSQSSVH
jgi:hypothetical protein